jgi:periplasmic protein TonB
MKRILIFFTFFLLSHITYSQATTPKATVTLINTKGEKIIDNDSTIFAKVEVESEFPGGTRAWGQYLQSHLVYPDKAVRKNIQGTVVLKFIVCNDGTVCNLEAITGPEILRKAAIEAFKNTPQWIPAVQDGRKVKSYKSQPIIFKLGG